MKINNTLLRGAIAILLFWIAIIILSGAGWNPLGVDWNFSNTGAFGDSFGPLSAIMAAIAAVSAVSAFRTQQDELNRLKERENEEDIRNQKSDFERTFFNLLNQFQNIRQSIDVESVDSTRNGPDAFKSMVHYFRKRTHSGLSQAWNQTFDQYGNDLGHYFRFLYHMIKFVDEHKIDNPYFYVRLIRSTLSEAELNLIMFNSIWGEGKEKFKYLIEQYSILHNLRTRSLMGFDFTKEFSGSAFDRTS